MFNQILSISKAEGKPGQVYYPLQLRRAPKPWPQGSELLIRISACAINHRDLFIRQHLYPHVAFNTALFSDGAGVVECVGPDANPSWKGARVVLNPGTGWRDSPYGPEEDGGYKGLGGTSSNTNGTGQKYVVIDQSQVEISPPHLSDIEAAAVCSAGLAAWRAVMVASRHWLKGTERNVLITGIGGGVALMALTFAIATGAKVYVTSSSADKIARAKELGARDGVNYRDSAWERKLLHLVGQRNFFDAIIDGAGADVVEKAVNLLKPGGVVSIYGMTAGPRAPFPVQAILQNIEVKGTSMGSRRDFADMIDFLRRTKAKPVVSRVHKGWDLDGVESLFEDMKRGTHFGKLALDLSERTYQDIRSASSTL